MNWNVATRSKPIEALTSMNVDDAVSNVALDDFTFRRLKNLYIAMQNKYGEPIGCGRHRVVFGNDRRVFKVPRNDYGFHDNAWEFRKFSLRNDKTIPMARCRIIDINEIPVLVMELLETGIPWRKLPDWATLVDGGQVGYDRNGNIVAYDYATF